MREMSETNIIPFDKIIVPDVRSTSKMTPEQKEFFEASARKVGIIQDPVVRTLGDGRWELVGGLSRINEWKAQGKTEGPFKIVKADELTALYMHLAENEGRGKSDPISRARVMKKALDLGAKLSDLCAAMGKSEQWGKRTLLLLELPPPIQKAISEEKLTPSHVYIAARLPTPDETFDALQTAFRLEWNSPVLETFVTNRLAQIQQAKEEAEAKGVEPEIPKAEPEQLIQYKQCLLCGYRVEAKKVTLTMGCEGCQKLVRYITSQLGSGDQAMDSVYAALEAYFGRQQPAPPAAPPAKEGPDSP